MTQELDTIAESGDDAARRVERLFQGDFGVAYTDRNRDVDPRKPAFFHELFRLHGVRRVLECGCNLGLNLGPAVDDAELDVWGIDIQATAITRARVAMPAGTFVTGSLLEMPFRDGWFDLAFTCGVLIHVPPAGIQQVLAEIHRISRRFILCAEYHDDQSEVAVPWRGQKSALWRRNYGALWQETFPHLELVDHGYRGPGEGFDRITWHLFGKPDWRCDGPEERTGRPA